MKLVSNLDVYIKMFEYFPILWFSCDVDHEFTSYKANNTIFFLIEKTVIVMEESFFFPCIIYFLLY